MTDAEEKTLNWRVDHMDTYELYRQAGRRELATELREYVEKEIVVRNPKRIDPYNCPEDLRGALTTLNGILYKLSELEELK